MVVMEHIEGLRIGTWTRRPTSKRGSSSSTLTSTSPEPHFVHGDLKNPNVLLRNEDELYVIDFEWAGKVNEARFPGSINKVFKRVGGEEGGLITPKMDSKLVQILLSEDEDD